METLYLVLDRKVVDLGTVGNNYSFFKEKIESEKLINFSIEVQDGLTEDEQLELINDCIENWESNI